MPQGCKQCRPAPKLCSPRHKKDVLATGHLFLYILQIGEGHHANKIGQSISKAREIVHLPTIMAPPTPALHMRP